MPLNFTTICTEYGRCVICYNERLNGVSYPKEYEIYSDYTDFGKVLSVTKVYYEPFFFFNINMYIIDDIGIEYAADVY